MLQLWETQTFSSALQTAPMSQSNAANHSSTRWQQYQLSTRGYPLKEYYVGVIKSARHPGVKFDHGFPSFFTHTYCLDQGKSWKVDVLLTRRVVSLKIWTSIAPCNLNDPWMYSCIKLVKPFPYLMHFGCAYLSMFVCGAREWLVCVHKWFTTFATHG